MKSALLLALLAPVALVQETPEALEARAGLVFERLARGIAAEQERALVELASLVEKQELAPHDAWAAVARARGEKLGPRGYVFRGGKWVDAGALERDLATSGLEGLGAALEPPAAPDRAARLAALDALGPEGHARADRALAARWQAALAQMQSLPGFDALVALAAEHAELEARRGRALQLIFDEETYFYPYDPPECPPEKARLYAGVQQEVDKRVAAVRECWKNPRRVHVPERLRALVEDLEWSRSVQKGRKLAFDWPSSVPEWPRWLDPAADTLELASFACSAQERARLAQDAAVAAFNTKAFAVREPDRLAEPNNEERAQLSITNEYRRMLGRAQLAWNRKLQLAAQKHSDYQSKTGEFGHFEQDPARRSPFERMKLEGYRSGGGENCHMGDSGPEGAHVGWIHSSGHHRQVLSERAHELGVGVSGSYWTQNYGDGNEWSAAPAPAPRR